MKQSLIQVVRVNRDAKIFKRMQTLDRNLDFYTFIILLGNLPAYTDFSWDPAPGVNDYLGEQVVRNFVASLHQEGSELGDA